MGGTGREGEIGRHVYYITCFIRTLIESIFRCLITFMFTLVRQLVVLSIGGSVEWLVGWSVMLLLRTRESSIMGKWVPGDILGLCFCVS